MISFGTVFSIKYPQVLIKPACACGNFQINIDLCLVPTFLWHLSNQGHFEGCENTNSIGLISEYVLTSGYPTIMARAMFPSCSTMLKVSLSQHPLLNIKTFSIIWTSLCNLLEGHTCVVGCPIQLTLIFMTLYLSFVFYKKCHSFKCEETQQGYLPYGTFLKTQLR